MPGSIVGAIANEGGLSSAQIGGIDIRADHTLVELPADLSSDQLRALSRTRIGGELIHLELDNGRRPASTGGGTGGGYKGHSGGSYERNDRGQGGFRKKFDGDRGHQGGFKRDGDRGYDRGAGQGHGGYADRKPRQSASAGGSDFGRKAKW